MEIKDISRADVLDILFEGRNKDYGAYDLRKTYNRRLTKALAATASICLLLIGGYTWAGKVRPSNAPLVVIDDSVMLVDPVHEQPIVPPPPVPKPPVQVATIRITPPIITPDAQVKPQDVPRPNDAADNVRIGTDTHDGVADVGIVEGPNGNGVTQGVIEFTVPAAAIDNNAAGTVIVQFVVDKEGNVSDVKVLSGPEELRAEAMRVIKKSGKWTPAIQNGRKVNSYKRQPIVVQLQND